MVRDILLHVRWLLAASVSATVITVSAGAASLDESLVVKAGQTVTTKDTYKLGEARVTVSGTLAVKDRFGSCVVDAVSAECTPNKLGTSYTFGLLVGEPGLPPLPLWYWTSSKRPPPARADHTYTITLEGIGGKLAFYAHPRSPPTPADQTVTGQFRIEIEGGGCAESRESASRRALNEVTVISCREGAEWRSPRGEWQDLKKNQVLKQGDELSTDPDGSVVLQFADNSTITVRSGTQIKIAAFFTEGGVVKTEVLLRMGEIAAQVNKSETARSDFKIKAPSSGGVRGTMFAVFRDPVGKAEVWSVREGIVEITPTGGRPKVTIKRGQEVEITPRAVSKIAPIGKAGAVAGLNRQKAIALVLKTLARSDDRCEFDLPRGNAYAAKSTTAGWLVTVKLTGKVKGISRWVAAKSKASPQNALAKTVARGCR